MEKLLDLWHATGLYNFTGGQVIMIAIGCIFLYLAIAKKFEPLLLVPIGFSAILTNLPQSGVAEPGGVLYMLYELGIQSSLFPLLIFMEWVH